MAGQNTDPTLMMFGNPQLEAAEETTIAVSPSPVDGTQVETGFDRLTGAAGRMTGKMAQINQRREMRKQFEQNYMRGEAGINDYVSQARTQIENRLRRAGIPDNEVQALAQYAVPSAEQFRDPQTGQVDILKYWSEAPDTLVEFEETIRDRGIEALRASASEALQGVTATATDEVDYAKQARAADPFMQFAGRDIEGASAMEELYGAPFRTQTELDEAEAERKAGITRAQYGRPQDVSSVIRGTQVAAESSANVNDAIADNARLDVVHGSATELGKKIEGIDKQIAAIEEGGVTWLEGWKLKPLQDEQRRMNSVLARYQENANVIESQGQVARTAAGVATGAILGGRNIGGETAQRETQQLYEGLSTPRDTTQAPAMVGAQQPVPVQQPTPAPQDTVGTTSSFNRDAMRSALYGN